MFTIAKAKTLKEMFVDNLNYRTSVMSTQFQTFGQKTFNSDNEYTPLIDGIRDIMPKVQEMYRDEILVAFKQFKRKDVVEYFDSLPVSQRSVELSKQMGDSINNLFEELLIAYGITLLVDQGDGFDWVYKNARETLIEDKNAMSQDLENRMWVGNANAGEKVSMHLLKRFELNEAYEITGAHVSLVNLSDTTQHWKSYGGARSSLSFTKADANGIIPVYGYWEAKTKCLFPRFEKI